MQSQHRRGHVSSRGPSCAYDHETFHPGLHDYEHFHTGPVATARALRFRVRRRACQPCPRAEHAYYLAHTGENAGVSHTHLVPPCTGSFGKAQRGGNTIWRAHLPLLRRPRHGALLLHPILLPFRRGPVCYADNSRLLVLPLCGLRPIPPLYSRRVIKHSACHMGNRGAGDGAQVSRAQLQQWERGDYAGGALDFDTPARMPV